MLRAAALTFTCAVLALTAAGCGESGSSGDADPATLVPAGAAFYAEAAVQPTGDRRDDALAAAGKILRTDDPAAKLRELIDAELAEEGDGLTWKGDFASWLGEDAGVWVTNLQADEPSFAVIVASKDADAAKAALAKFEKTDETPSAKRSFKGLDYKLDKEGVAHGMIDDFLVIGTEDAFKRTAEMRDGGDSLADADRYKDAVGKLDEDRLGHYFFDVKPVVDAALKQDPAAAQQLEQFKSVLPLDKLEPITGSFQADGDGMALDTVLTGLPEGPLRDLAGFWSGGETELLADLPSAWGAFATPKLGESAQKLFSSFAGAIGGAAIAGQFKQATGLDLQQDVFSWVGDAGVFVRGASEADLDGALVIEATDDAKAAAAFGKIVALIGKEAGTNAAPVKLKGAESAVAIPSGSDKQIILARGPGRVVAAYGEKAATDALGSDSRLGDSAEFDAAEKVLGDGMKPSFLLSLPEVFKLVEAMGETDADYQKAKPYLEALGVVTSGGKVDGDRVESRIAVTLK